jgi:2-amino-4-hydroxy-6-hydroxymethyldihydropteridine diphosphokinase
LWAKCFRPAGLSSTPLVAIALGSNLGDREAHLDFALSRLSAFLSDTRVSSRRDTEPVDVSGEQPTYLNAAVVGRTELAPHDLLRELQRIEADRGRERPYANAPRTLDLDLILYDGLMLADVRIVLPHPRFRERRFVIEPLVEIAPDLVDPVTRLSMRALLARLA